MRNLDTLDIRNDRTSDKRAVKIEGEKALDKYDAMYQDLSGVVAVAPNRFNHDKYRDEQGFFLPHVKNNVARKQRERTEKAQDEMWLMALI